jgi:thiol:disulfide interchange protein
MGFLMMATLLWLLYVLGRQLGMEAVIWTGAFLLSVGIACWMIGRFVTLTVSRRRAIAVWIGALAVVLAGYFVFLNGVLDLQALIAGTSDQGAAGDTEGRSGIVWERFSLHNLESRLSGNRPVFLDFTADWCLTCKVNEHAVLSDQAVIDALRSSNFVPMRADWTTRNPEITELLQKFGRPGVPLYVIFPAGKPTHPIILPEVITPKIVLDGLRKAVAAP